MWSKFPDVGAAGALTGGWAKPKDEPEATVMDSASLACSVQLNAERYRSG